MAFGPIIDAPLMSFVYYLLHRRKEKIVNFVRNIKLPKLLLAMLLAVPLLVFEENINCKAESCQLTFFPATVPVLLVFEFVFLLISKKLKAKTPEKKAIYYCIFGVLFEFLLGHTSKQLLASAPSKPLLFVFMMFWVAFSYWFVIYLPLLVIEKKES